MYNLFLTCFLAAGALAAPIEERADGPTVTIQNGTVIGSSNNNIDTFNGIPFAQPPTGPLRLKPPQTANSSFGTLDATGIPAACPFLVTQLNTSSLPSYLIAELLNLPIIQQDSGFVSEDCLTLNVQRPSSATSDSKLPVVVWIFGGGFELGSTSMYSGSNIVSRSVELGADVIYVAINYRYCPL